jgi:O-antigen/teichoic acid export membrane protein
VSDRDREIQLDVSVPDSEPVAPDATAGVARDAGLAVGARIAAMACTTITTFVVAGMLSKSEYGAYAIVFGIQVLLVMALDLGLTSSLARYVAQGRSTTRLVVAIGVLRLAIIGVAALALLVAPTTPWLEDSRSLVVTLLPVLAALVVAQSLVAYFFGLLPSLRRIRLLLLVTVAQPAVELGLILLARSRGGDVEEVVLATVAAGFAVSAIAWVLLLAPGRAAARDVPDLGSAQHATVRMVAEYGRRIFVVSLLLAVFGQVDQFVIGWFHPLSEVAPYALALKVQAMLAAPAIVVAGIVAPRIAGAGAAGLELYRQWLAFVTVVTVGAVLTICVLSPQLFGAFDPAYAQDWPIVVGMSAFLVLSAVAPLPTIALNQTGHARERLPIAGVTVAVNVVLDLALVPWLGAWGAVISTTIAFAYYLARHHALAERELGAVATPGAMSIRGTLARGAAMAVLAAAVAALMRLLLDATVGDPADFLVLVVAGGAAAAVHVAWSLRLLRP